MTEMMTEWVTKPLSKEIKGMMAECMMKPLTEGRTEWVI